MCLVVYPLDYENFKSVFYAYLARNKPFSGLNILSTKNIYEILFFTGDGKSDFLSSLLAFRR